MKLNDIDVIKLLPLFMRKDKFNVFLAQYMSDLVKEVSLNIDKFSVFNCIDKLDDEECDLLAWELNIDYYEKSLNLDEKHKILNSAFSTSTPNTKYAVEKILENELGEGVKVSVVEWFEENLPVNHFFVVIKSQKEYDSNKIMKIINSFVRKTAICDEIKYEITNVGI